MKIGLVIYGSLDTLSGGYLYDRMLVDALRAQGDAVEIISLPWRNYLSHLADNLSFRLPAGLDVVIQDELNHPSLIAANLPPHRYPVISLVHHLRCSEQRPAWQNAFYRFVERRYLSSVDGFIFNSETTRRVVHALVGNDKTNLVAYPPTDRFGDGLSAEATEAAERICARSKEDTPLRLLFIGNVIPRKGLHTLLNALTRLPKGSVQLDIVGSLVTDPHYAGEMQKQAGKVNPASIRFHDALNNDPLIAMLKTSHVLVVPSSYEGFGIVYLEGMAFGLPAIGTKAGAAPELIEEGRTGYLIDPDDDQALASHLAALARDRELLTHLSLNAWQRYRKQPKWEQTAKQIRQFLLAQIRRHSN
jgi:glycosyltransferase involved in cell wall biosynthesis